MEMPSGYAAALPGENNLMCIFVTTIRKALKKLGVSRLSSVH